MRTNQEYCLSYFNTIQQRRFRGFLFSFVMPTLDQFSRWVIRRVKCERSSGTTKRMKVVLEILRALWNSFKEHQIKFANGAPCWAWGVGARRSRIWNNCYRVGSNQLLERKKGPILFVGNFWQLRNSSLSEHIQRI